MIVSSTPRSARLCLLILPCLLLAVAGCNRGPETVRVRGKVLYKDGSVPRGGVRVVRFEPTQETTAEVRQVAGGSIGDDGSFEMCRRVPGDGVIPGKYAVTFTVWKAPRVRESLIDEKYTKSATTPYQVTVEGDIDDLKFEIEPIGAAKAQASQ